MKNKCNQWSCEEALLSQLFSKYPISYSTNMQMFALSTMQTILLKILYIALIYIKSYRCQQLFCAFMWQKKKKSHIVTECYTENFNDTEIDLFLLTEATFLYRCWRRETVIIALEWKTRIEDFNSSFSIAVIKETWKSL